MYIYIYIYHIHICICLYHMETSDSAPLCTLPPQAYALRFVAIPLLLGCKKPVASWLKASRLVVSRDAEQTRSLMNHKVTEKINETCACMCARRIWGAVQ